MNTEETMLALLAEEWVIEDGRNSALRVHLIDGEIKNQNGTTATLGCDVTYSIYKAPDWRENIPECGILGEFWDDDSGDKMFGVLALYNTFSSYPYKPERGMGFQYFNPRTEQEIRALCDEWIKAIPEVGL